MAIQRFSTKAAAGATGGQVSWVFDDHGNHWESRTDVDIAVDIRPTVSKWQLVQACADAGITEAQLDASVALLTVKRQRFWKHTNVVDRDNPFSSNLRTNLTPVPTPSQWNAIFVSAAALDPLVV